MFDGAKPLKYSGVKGSTGCTAATAQYIGVKFNADNQVIPCTATTDKCCGILQQPVPAAGEPAEVVYGGETLMQAAASVTAGDPISISAAGQAQTAVAGQYVIGTAVNVAGATTAGTLITVVVDCAAPTVV